jgi:hypothetical protein
MTVAGDEQYQLVFRPEGELLARTRMCEAGVFLSAYGNTEADFIEEYGAYEEASYFIALVDSCGEVVGSCRLIVPSPAGLKTVNDVARSPWGVDGARAVRATGADLSRAWDVATLAVRKDRAVTPLASAALYHGLVLATRANGVRWIVMMLDERARRLLAMAGFVARPIPGTGPAPYLGSAATTPLVGDVAAMIDAQRRENPDAYRLMSMGLGFTDIEIPPLSDWVVSNWDRAASRDVVPGLARTA